MIRIVKIVDCCQVNLRKQVNIQNGSFKTFSTPNQKKPLPCFKYFINRSVCLQQYREALKLAKDFDDLDMKIHIRDTMRHEFLPLKKFIGATQQDEQVQSDIDYILAKCRQRIN